MAKHWIKGAIKHPGALRHTAERLGYMGKGGTISSRVMAKLKGHANKTGNTRLKREVSLAKTLKKMH